MGALVQTNMPTEIEQRIEYVPKVEVTLEQAVDNLRKLDQIRQKIMRQGVDYDVIPGTPKPTLLKPGAERLLQFFGLGHKIQLVDKKEDWDNGFFYYQYKVTIVKQYPGYEIIVAECEGSANSKERRYRNQDVFSIVNTLQKMAIKRALVGATLQATGTSGMFTQDLEDMDLEGQQVSTQQKVYTDTSGTITQKQAKRMFALANGDNDLVKNIIGKYGYEHSTDVRKTDYEKICAEIETAAQADLPEFLQDNNEAE
ncbi:hypothetical protein BVF91_05930 [Thermoanaerobacterium sp. PSU-2]|uniref:hypothetical protein n=1 Tax=Thermoanaerobacterium sp. PSU-2 TaxID=1930849 RepID=UPI000A14B933|nr:hypothetical protein [Thermoanaerobacterium sp. PSU-2]ORX23368.1 hypothetical protein BVF91_05930 [Thermoanaerobacterium sp. PSU-2]